MGNDRSVRVASKNSANAKKNNRRSTKRNAYTARKDNFMSKNSEVPVKDVSKKYGQTIQEKTKKSSDILNKSYNQNTMASPTRASNINRTKQNRFNTSYNPTSANKRESSQVNRLASVKKSSRGDAISKLNSSYVHVKDNNK